MARLTLRDYQEECVNAHFSYFRDCPDGNPLFVVPTGGGKSLIIAEFISHVLQVQPKAKILVLTHVKELIRQNYEEFVGHWDSPVHPAGIYSAGLGRKELDASVIFAGIQSICRRAEHVGRVDVVLIDEAHLVPKKGMGRYRTFLDAVKAENPHLRVCGYTATHYRVDGGYLHEGEGRIFTDVAYDVPVDLLVNRGHLVPLVAKLPEEVIDVTGVRTKAGEFKADDLEAAVMGDPEMVTKAVEESVRRAREAGRKHWLFFACSVEHANQIVECLEGDYGVETRKVYGHTPKDERDAAVQDFRDGRFTALVNVGVLTTGFNAPRCDMMAVMRPTKSTALYVQIMGRGMRTFPGKENCLVLDFGDNVRRHGPINMVQPLQTGDGDEPPPMKMCPTCRSLILGGLRYCPECNHEFPPRESDPKHGKKASTVDPIAKIVDGKKEETVFFRTMHEHKSAKGNITLKVSYTTDCHHNRCEWVCPEFPEGSYPRKKFIKWWDLHGGSAPYPLTAKECLERERELAIPSALLLSKQDGKWYTVTGRKFTHEEVAGRWSWL